MFATLIIKAFFVSRRFNTTENAQVLAILFAILSFLVTRTVLSLTENMDKVFLLIALLCGSLQKQNEKTLSQRSEVSYPIHSH
jgi:hypothetical protein